MCEAITTALIGLIGAAIGGLVTYLSVDKQLNFERRKLEKEESEKVNIALSIIRTFLLEEINKNYMIIQKADGELVKMLKGEIGDINRQIANVIFHYNDFNNIKFEIIKYNVQEVLDTIDIYNTFKLIQNNSLKRYAELKEKEKKFIKDGINKCEKFIKLIDLE